MNILMKLLGFENKILQNIEINLKNCIELIQIYMFQTNHQYVNSPIVDYDDTNVLLVRPHSRNTST